MFIEAVEFVRKSVPAAEPVLFALPEITAAVRAGRLARRGAIGGIRYGVHGFGYGRSAGTVLLALLRPPPAAVHHPEERRFHPRHPIGFERGHERVGFQG